MTTFADKFIPKKIPFPYGVPGKYRKGRKAMNITEAVERACQEPTLVKALSWICVWESERVVRQAKRELRDFDGKGWDTCFKVCLMNVAEKYDYRPKEENKVFTVYELIVFLLKEFKGNLNNPVKFTIPQKQAKNPFTDAEEKDFKQGGGFCLIDPRSKKGEDK